MSNIYEEIADKYTFFNTKPANLEDINDAESKLDRLFSSSYKKYLLKYGAISFADTELTGLNIEKYANVVDVTLREIRLNKNLPEDCVVLENIGVEGLLILINSKGEVFEWKNDNAIKLYESMEDYLRTKI